MNKEATASPQRISAPFLRNISRDMQEGDKYTFTEDQKKKHFVT